MSCTLHLVDMNMITETNIHFNAFVQCTLYANTVVFFFVADHKIFNKFHASHRVNNSMKEEESNKNGMLLAYYTVIIILFLLNAVVFSVYSKDANKLIKMYTIFMYAFIIHRERLYVVRDDSTGSLYLVCFCTNKS